MSNYLQRLRPLPHDSEDFSRIEYFVRMSYNSATARVRDVFPLASEDATAQFSRRVQNMRTLDCLVDRGALGDDNNVQDIIERGMRIPSQGIVFNAGAVDPPAEMAPINGEFSGGLFETVFCRTVVGKSYCVDDASAAEKSAIPDGYDSICFPADSEQDRVKSILEKDSESSSVEPSDVLFGLNSIYDVDRPAYNYRYLITDAKRVLPTFLVQVEFHDDEERKRVPMCDVCEEMPAILFCEADQARLCEKCDRDVHSGNKLLSRHRRTPLDTKKGKFGTCPIHTDQTVEFFDPLVHIPVCVYCKMVGSHSAGEFATHKLIPVSEAYESALDASKKPDNVLQDRLKAIKKQIQAVDSRLREVKSNASSVEEQIYQLLQEALFQLQEESQKKVSALLAEEMDLRRQLRAVQFMESFLEKQQDVLGPVEFLSAWNNHTKLRSDLYYARPFEHRINVEADIKLVGRVEIVKEKEGQTQANSMNSVYPSVADPFSTIRASGNVGMLTPGRGAPTGVTESHVSPSADFWNETLRKKRDDESGPMAASQLRGSSGGGGASFINVIFRPELSVVRALTDITESQDADELAQALVRIFESKGLTLQLLRNAITKEVKSTDSANLLLRSNSIATKMMTSYSQMIGVPYLRLTLSPVVKEICADPLAFEVDPARVPSDREIKSNFRNLVGVCQRLLDTIIGSLRDCPPQFRHICQHLQSEVIARFPDRRHTAVGGFIFLRFFCPALVSPDSFGLMDAAPSREARRVLTLVAKTMVNMANGIPFGAKEPTMKDMNEFIMTNLKNLKSFFDSLSTVERGADEGRPMPVSEETRNNCVAVVSRHVRRNLDRICETLSSSDSDVSASELRQVIDH